MDIIVLFNGLGNQMSQYSLYLSKLRSGQSVSCLPISNAHNGFELDSVFGIRRPGRFRSWVARAAFHFFWSKRFALPDARRHFAKRLRLHRYDENMDYNFQDDAWREGEGLRFLVGGWHTEKYFHAISDEVRNLFVFERPSDPLNTSALQQIQATTSVSLHVRRGDYNDSANGTAFGSVCAPDFYRRALEEIRSRVPDFLLVVFSNDPSWAQDNILHPNALYVTWNQGSRSWIDMSLMSQCTHNIICNSTFSWWGAWLNRHPEKIVVCPDRFVASEIRSQVYPDEWIRVKTFE